MPIGYARSSIVFNPLTPVPAVTGRGEPRPFFHFWRHSSWPNMTSSILNSCRRKTSFQWCPDQGDWPNGARDMRKNAQKVEWKTRSKISCHCTWLFHRKICPSRWRFRKRFLTTSKPSRRSITAAKRIVKEIKERRKKNSKIEKPKDVGPNFDFSACRSQDVIKRDASGENGKLSCHRCIFDQIKVNLVEIQPEKLQNVQKTRFLQKAPGFNGLIIHVYIAHLHGSCNVAGGRYLCICHRLPRGGDPGLMWGNMGTLWGLCNNISALRVGEMWGLRFCSTERRLGMIDC